MKKMISRARFWTYSLTYGLGPVTPLFNLRHINGSGLGGSYLDTLIASWMTTRMKLTQQVSSASLTTLSTLRQWSSRRFRPYSARHRGTGRQTYVGIRALRLAREEAWDSYQAFLALRDPSTVGVGYEPGYGRGAMVYRGLAPSVLNRETKELIRRFAPRDWLD